MIDKSKLKELLNQNKLNIVYEAIFNEYIDTLKDLLIRNGITIDDDITLIECITLVELKIPNSELITHIPLEAIFNESRELESRMEYAITWYDKWKENINNVINK